MAVAREDEEQFPVFRQGRGREAGHRIGPQAGIEPVVGGDFGEEEAGLVRVSRGQRPHHLQGKRRIPGRKEIAQHLHRQLGMSGRGEPQGVALRFGRCVRIEDLSGEHIGIRDARSRFADEQAGVLVPYGCGEVHRHATELLDEVLEAREVHLDVVVDGDAEVPLDRVDQVPGTIHAGDGAVYPPASPAGFEGDP